MAPGRKNSASNGLGAWPKCSAAEFLAGPTLLVFTGGTIRFMIAFSNIDTKPAKGPRHE
jgi:hypothetical protein